MSNLGRRGFFAFMVLNMVLWSVGGISLPVRGATALADGDLIKGSGNAVYYYTNGERFVFPTAGTYKTWYSNFSAVKTIMDDELAAVPIGGNVTYRPGTRWVKITTDPKVYAVESNGMLRWVSSEAMAVALHGANWNKTIDDIPDAFFAGNYEVSDALDEDTHPVGSLIKYEGSADVYYVAEGPEKRKIASGDAFMANWFRDEFVYATSVAYEDGDPITGAEAALRDVSQSGAGEPGDEEPGDEEPSAGKGDLDVSLSKSNPGATSVIADSTGTGGDGAQAFAPFLALDFEAGDSDATVNTLKFSRLGISSDTDLSNVYLKEGSTILAEMNSFSSKVVTFSSGAGLFKVKAGETRTIWLVGDITNGTTAGKTLGFSLAEVGHVTTDGGDVSGSFPLNGSLMTTAAVTDLGRFSITNTTTFPSTIDAGPDVQEFWRFTVQGQDQNIDVKKLGVTMVGTVKEGDLQGLYLEVDGSPITQPQEFTGGTNQLMFSFDPAWRLTQGQTKIVILKGKVINGAGRTFEWTIRDEAQAMAQDVQYGAYLKLNGSNTFALIESDTAGTGTTINAGTLTISRATTSPTGSLALSALQQTLAIFDMKAYGEDMKVDTFNVSTLLSSDTTGGTDLNNGKLLLGGSQIGTTQDLQTVNTSADVDCSDTDATNDDTCFASLGNTVIIKAGETKQLSIVADVLSGAGAALTNGSTVTVALNAGGDATAADGATGANNLTRQSSLGTTTTNASSGNQLTLTSGAISVAKNLAMADGNSSNPTAVLGAVGAKISTFTITASAAEGASVTSITIADAVDTTFATEATGNSLADFFQNLRLMTAGGVPIGTTKGTLTDSDTATYSFSATPALDLQKSEQLVVNVYADVKSGLTATQLTQINTTDVNGEIQISSVTATGKETSTSVGVTSQTIALQNMFLASSGALTVALDAATPKSGQLVMGDSDQTLGIFKLTATTAEDIKVKKLVLAINTWDFGAWSNLKLYDQAGKPLGNIVSSLSNVNSGTATAGSTTSITLSSAVAPIADATASAYVGAIVAITNGNADGTGGEGQSRVITAYSTARLATVATMTAATTSSVYVVGGQAVFDLGDALVVPKGDDLKVTLKGTVNQFPNTVSGVPSLTPILPDTTGALTAYASEVRGVDSNSTITPTGFTAGAVSANAQDVYRTKTTVTKHASSPSGTSTASTTQEVLRFTVTAHANRDAVVNAITFTTSGTAVAGAAAPNLTGTAATNLYDVNDLNTVLATEAYKTVTCTSGSTNTCVAADGAFDAIPIGARVYAITTANGVANSAYRTVTINSGTTITLDSVLLVALANNDVVRYLPLAGSAQRIFMGAQTTITGTADIATTATAIPVTSTNGFATGDVVTILGYTSATGNALTSLTGTACMIASLTATQITLDGTITAVCTTVSPALAAIDPDFLVATSGGPTFEALSTKHTGRAIVFTGLLNANSGELVSKGTSKTYVLKGDTTGLTTNNTLQLEIGATSDFNWDDGMVFGVTTITKDIPVRGGTLLY